jgi:AraC-like DNA-binding protein
MLLHTALLIGATSALSLLIALLAARDSRHLLAARILVALALSIGVGCLSILPAAVPPSAIDFGLRLASVPSIGLAWWFAWSILDDRFQLDWLKWAGLALTCIYPMYYSLAAAGVSVPRLSPLFSELGIAPPLLVCLHMLWIAISGFRDDLLESRRRVRIWIVVAVALASLASVGAEYVPTATTVALLKARILLPVAIAGALWLVRLQPELLASDEAPLVQAEKPRIDPRDAAALQRLLQIMQDERPFLDPDLTLDGLAVKVGVPSHQLRVIINRGMGQRNFSTYIAKARIECAKAALADKNQARTQILRVAMDAGFPTLATFNRTFKTMEGVTPTEFRAKALENSAQN